MARKEVCNTEHRNRPTRRPIVLLVEDDQGDYELAEQSFAQASVPTTLYWVHDGDEALAFVRKEESYADAPSPDLILLGLNLPAANGIQIGGLGDANPGNQRTQMT